MDFLNSGVKRVRTASKARKKKLDFLLRHLGPKRVRTTSEASRKNLTIYCCLWESKTVKCERSGQGKIGVFIAEFGSEKEWDGAREADKKKFDFLLLDLGVKKELEL